MCDREGGAVTFGAEPCWQLWAPGQQWAGIGYVIALGAHCQNCKNKHQ